MRGDAERDTSCATSLLLAAVVRACLTPCVLGGQGGLLYLDWNIFKCGIDAIFFRG